MSYTSQDHATDKSEFCQLGSELIISYNGSLIECIPSIRSSLVGTILTRTGQLVSRTTRGDNWENVSSPFVYLFYDNDSNATFLVDTCKCKIKEIDPHGRILDCTDRIIYEIQCGKWVPVCDLSNNQQRTIFLANSVPATATTASFEFPGVNPIVDPFSEVLAANVVFLGNTATVTFPATGPGSLPAGGSTVLVFTTCVDCELVTIVKFFTRLAAVTTATRFSAQAGQIGVATAPIATAITATPFPGVADPLGGLLAPTLLIGSGARAFPVATWFEIYDLPAPGIFDPATGIATITTGAAGNYLVTAQLSYTSPAPIPNAAVTVVGTTPTAITLRTAVPYFALVRSTGVVGGGVIVDVAPVTAQLVSAATLPVLDATAATATLFLATLGIPLPAGADPATFAAAVAALIPAGATFYDVNEIGEAVFTIGLTLNANDRLQIVFVDPLAVTATAGPALPTLPAVPVVATAPGYRLIPLGTTFNATRLL